MMSKFSVSQALLAIAIAYFAYALLNFSKEIPSFINAIDRTTPHISTIVDEVELVRAEVTQVRALVDKQVPEILGQINNILPLVEQGLEQSEQYSKQLPNLWQHLDKVEMQLQALQKDLPEILNRIDAVVLMSNDAISESAKWRPHSTKYLTAIEYSRDDIPQYLTRVEDIVVDARNIGKEASSGLVSGFFKGVISLPFEVVAGLTGIVDSTSRSAKYLTANDITMMQETVLILLEADSNKQLSWQNNESGNRGKISKNMGFIKKGETCHKVTFINYFKGQKETLKEVMCKDKNDIWQVI